MQVNYELTQQDFFEAIWAHRGRNVLSKWTWRLIIAVICLHVLAAIYLLIFVPDSRVLSDLRPLFGIAVLWAALVWVLPWWSARMQFTKQPAAQGSKTMHVDDSGVQWQWKGGNADIQWANFVRALEGRNQFLLYSSPACFNIIPKRAFDIEQLTAFRALIAQKVPAKNR